MRTYPRNSPEAAARIVALVLISDGHVSRSEMEAIKHQQVEHELGMSPGGFSEVMQTLCEDLLMGAYGTPTMMCSIDQAALASLMSEVDRPDLQCTVLRLAQAAAEADRHMADAEALVMESARRHWQMETGPATQQAPMPVLQPAAGAALQAAAS